MMSDEWFRMRAKEIYHEEGELEVDTDACVSRSDDDGAYVAAWVWVSSKEEESHSQVQAQQSITG
jgi:hypothetical protein